MTDLVFVDTNVLIYARDRKSVEKRRVAQDWLSALGQTGRGRTNFQVINEFTRWVLVNEARRPLPDIRAEVDKLRVWGDTPVEADHLQLAWIARQHFGFQWFDCLLLAAARLLDCGYFLTEDMSEGVNFGPMRLINPFNTDPSTILQTH